MLSPALYHASNDSRISETDSEVGLSCLFARRRRGRLSSRGEFKTSSNEQRQSNIVYYQIYQKWYWKRGRIKEEVKNKTYRTLPRFRSTSLDHMHQVRTGPHDIHRNTSARWIVYPSDRPGQRSEVWWKVGRFCRLSRAPSTAGRQRRTEMVTVRSAMVEVDRVDHILF